MLKNLIGKGLLGELNFRVCPGALAAPSPRALAKRMSSVRAHPPGLPSKVPIWNRTAVRHGPSTLGKTLVLVPKCRHMLILRTLRQAREGLAKEVLKRKCGPQDRRN
jgi:hypothetical protein